MPQISLGSILDQGLNQMNKNKENDRSLAMAKSVDDDISAFTRIINGSPIFPLIAKDDVCDGIKAVYLFTHADNNVFLLRSGKLAEVPRAVSDIKDIKEHPTSDMVLKYGPGKIKTALLEAAKNFRSVENDIADYGKGPQIL